MDGKKTYALILAAGISSRMGMPKYDLKLSDGTTFLESLIDQYLAFGCEQIVVVMNQKGIKSILQSGTVQNSRVKIKVNPTPQAGRFLSIKLGLKESGFDGPVFMQNVDNPFASREVLAELITHFVDCDFVKPVYKGKGGHPVLIGQKIIRYVLEQPDADLNFKSFLERFSEKAVEVEDDSILTNINTKEDYQELLSDFSFKK
jgi:molybdenum cofactor cytidylyltransferase